MAAETAFLRDIALRQQAALQEYGILEVVQVEDEPVTLEEAYSELQIDADSDGSPHDSWLNLRISIAREWFEWYLGRSLAPRTMSIASTGFPTAAVANGPYIPLPFGPVQSVESVTFQTEETVLDSNGDPELDTSGDEVTEVVSNTLLASGYVLDRYVTPSRIVLARGLTWPAALYGTNSVVIRYVTGYMRVADSSGLPVIPRVAKGAILSLVAYWFANREGGGKEDIPMQFMAMADLIPGRERLGFA